MRGQTYEVLSGANQGWVKIRTGGREGFIRTAGNATVVEKARESVDENIKKRRQVVEYAMQFVGGRYVYGAAARIVPDSQDMCFPSPHPSAFPILPRGSLPMEGRYPRMRCSQATCCSTAVQAASTMLPFILATDRLSMRQLKKRESRHPHMITVHRLRL